MSLGAQLRLPLFEPNGDLVEEKSYKLEVSDKNICDGKEVLAIILIFIIITIILITGCTQIPISTLSHIWVFVRLYEIVIIVIIVIIIIMIIKSEGANAQL